eukprot:g36506.t1
MAAVCMGVDFLVHPRLVVGEHSDFFGTQFSTHLLMKSAMVVAYSSRFSVEHGPVQSPRNPEDGLLLPRPSTATFCEGQFKHL